MSRLLLLLLVLSVSRKQTQQQHFAVEKKKMRGAPLMECLLFCSLLLSATWEQFDSSSERFWVFAFPAYLLKHRLAPSSVSQVRERQRSRPPWQQTKALAQLQPLTRTSSCCRRMATHCPADVFAGPDCLTGVFVFWLLETRRCGDAEGRWRLHSVSWGLLLEVFVRWPGGRRKPAVEAVV